MVDNTSEAGRQAVERARRAAETEPLGPGTSGHTTSGAAYQGQNVADARGVPGPAEQGFGGTRTGLGYTADTPPAASGYDKADTFRGASAPDLDDGTAGGGAGPSAGQAGPSQATGPSGVRVKRD